METCYTLCPTPAGEVYVAWSQAGIGFLASRLSGPAAFLDRLKARRGWQPVRDDSRQEELTAMLADWFAGHPYTGPLDLGPLTPFARAVIAATRAIPRGQVRTYAEVARAAGRPGAARAVGNVMAWNPVPLLVPCHRVVRSDGSIGPYSDGGPTWKEWLLRWEGADLAALRALPEPPGPRRQRPPRQSGPEAALPRGQGGEPAGRHSLG